MQTTSPREEMTWKCNDGRESHLHFVWVGRVDPENLRKPGAYNLLQMHGSGYAETLCFDIKNGTVHHESVHLVTARDPSQDIFAQAFL